jgi:hypothetical protein
MPSRTLARYRIATRVGRSGSGFGVRAMGIATSAIGRSIMTLEINVLAYIVIWLIMIVGGELLTWVFRKVGVW